MLELHFDIVDETDVIRLLRTHEYKKYLKLLK